MYYFWYEGGEWFHGSDPDAGPSEKRFASYDDAFFDYTGVRLNEKGKA